MPKKHERKQKKSLKEKQKSPAILKRLNSRRAKFLRLGKKVTEVIKEIQIAKTYSREQLQFLWKYERSIDELIKEFNAVYAALEKVPANERELFQKEHKKLTSERERVWNIIKTFIEDFKEKR